MRFITRVLLFSGAAVLISSAQADVYKCQDSSGHVTYQSTACDANDTAETIKIKEVGAGSSPSQPRNTADEIPENGSNEGNREREPKPERDQKPEVPKNPDEPQKLENSQLDENNEGTVTESASTSTSEPVSASTPEPDETDS